MVDTTTTTATAEVPTGTTAVTVVPVQSAWLSKINITQLVQLVCGVAVIASGGKLNISPDVQLALVGGILAAGNIATVIFKTYFTSTVTPQSVTAQAVTAVK